MNRVPSLAVALLLNSAQPLLLGTALSIGAGAISVAAAQAQSAEAVGKIAQTVTVRIEGATQGSGVLVKREANRYTVLTAWHVVSGQRPGEELDIYTPDGQRHQVEQGSIKRLGEVDLAVLNFRSSNSYEEASVGDVKSVSSGSNIYVSGFPLPTSAVPTRLFRFLDGKVIANATVAIPNGYQLLYSNSTLPGMSGGAVLNGQGQLVGIHASAERADQISETSGKDVATGTNQAVPVTYYRQYSSGAAVVASSSQGTNADDYLAQAQALLGKKGREQEVIKLANQVLTTKESSDAYAYRAFAKDDLGDKLGAITDYNQAIAINAKNAMAYAKRGKARSEKGDNNGAIADLDMALSIDPRLATWVYTQRAVVKAEIGDNQGAVDDMIRHSIAFKPSNASDPRNKIIEGTGLGVAQASAKLLREGDATEAARLAKLATILIPNDPRAWVLLAEAQLRSNQDSKASISLAKARALDPNNAGVLFAQGSLALKGGRPSEASTLIRQGLQLDSKNPAAFFDLGNSYMLTNSPQDALNAFERASQLKPDFWEAINNQALVLFEGNRKDEAIKLWRRAIGIKQAAEPMMAIAAALNSASPGNMESVKLAERALKEDPTYVLESTQRESLWGEQLRSAAKKLLDNTKLKSMVDSAILRSQSSKPN